VGLILTTYISSADTTPEILLSDKQQTLIRKYNQSSATLIFYDIIFDVVTTLYNIINDGGTYYSVLKFKFLTMQALGYSEVFVSTYHTTGVP
jgi:hypothetical protein